MVDLYTALKLINALNSEDDIVHLIRKGQVFKSACMGLTVKQIKNRFDMRKTKVAEIAPYFCCGDYEGFLLTITD